MNQFFNALLPANGTLAKVCETSTARKATKTLLSKEHSLLFALDLRRLEISTYGRRASKKERHTLYESLAHRYEHQLFHDRPSAYESRTLQGKLAHVYELLGNHPEAAHLRESANAKGFPAGSAGFWSLMGVELVS